MEGVVAFLSCCSFGYDCCAAVLVGVIREWMRIFVDWYTELGMFCSLYRCQ